MKLLIDNGADVNAQSGDYGDALQVALQESQEQIVELLLDKSAYVNSAAQT
jgi:ankyrin repeat protein